MGNTKYRHATSYDLIMFFLVVLINYNMKKKGERDIRVLTRQWKTKVHKQSVFSCMHFRRNFEKKNHRGKP